MLNPDMVEKVGDIVAAVSSVRGEVSAEQVHFEVELRNSAQEPRPMLFQIAKRLPFTACIETHARASVPAAIGTLAPSPS